MANMSDGILMLNDHCLLEIFKHLSLIDLANFKEIFTTVGSVVDMEFSKQTLGSFFFGCRDRMDTSFQIIKQFGTSINELTINYHGWYERKWSEIFTIIREHCSESLTALTLCGDAVGLINDADIFLIVDILKNLETLELKNLNYELRTNHTQDFVNILPHCDHAKSITIISYIDLDANAITFQCNKELRKVKLRGPTDLKAIVDDLANVPLEELTISWVNANMSPDFFLQNLCQLLRLVHLKSLTIDCWYMDIGPFLLNIDSFHSLNVLSLTNAELNLDLQMLARMKRLKVLKLRQCCLATQFPFESVALLCGQPNFEHLILLCYREPIDEVNFLKLVEQRQKSAAERRLYLTLTNIFYDKTISIIPNELLEENRATLTLIDDNDSTYEYYALDREEQVS